MLKQQAVAAMLKHKTDAIINRTRPAIIIPMQSLKSFSFLEQFENSDAIARPNFWDDFLELRFFHFIQFFLLILFQIFDVHAAHFFDQILGNHAVFQPDGVHNQRRNKTSRC
ncbi:hypothetical protein MsAm2_05160 [Methanolapillus ohkumae]|uniref:Uncharacterized protein n=1 Tax=Methanolapillus ohkumae TaxID=3028298 RepID=A0AA96V6H7_9EURY|nr:hypothetical protein MsAm2_05160 [Methanosarcinaceae archaeon Am2]